MMGGSSRFLFFTVFEKHHIALNRPCEGTMPRATRGFYFVFCVDGALRTSLRIFPLFISRRGKGQKR